MLRLYHRPNTGRPARVRWALEEAGAPAHGRADARGDRRRGARAPQAAEARVAAAVAALEQPLRRYDHIAGADFTIADVLVGSTLAIGVRLDRLPRNATVDEYYDRLDARPAKQRAYAAWLEQYPPPPAR